MPHLHACSEQCWPALSAPLQLLCISQGSLPSSLASGVPQTYSFFGSFVARAVWRQKVMMGTGRALD